MMWTTRLKQVVLWLVVFLLICVFQVQIFEVILGEPNPYLWLLFIFYFMFYRPLKETLVVIVIVSLFLTGSSSLSIARLIVSLFISVMVGAEIQKKFFSRQAQHFFLACIILLPLWMGLYFGNDVIQFMKLRAFLYTLLFIVPFHWLMRLCDRYDSQ